MSRTQDLGWLMIGASKTSRGSFQGGEGFYIRSFGSKLTTCVIEIHRNCLDNTVQLFPKM